MAIGLSLKTRLLLAVAATALIAAACAGGSGGDGGDDNGTDGDDLTFDDLGLDDQPPPVVGWNTDWSNRTISLTELVVGIGRPDPRDVIPPIDEPAFETVEEAAEWLVDREPVVLLVPSIRTATTRSIAG